MVVEIKLVSLHLRPVTFIKKALFSAYELSTLRKKNALWRMGDLLQQIHLFVVRHIKEK